MKGLVVSASQFSAYLGALKVSEAEDGVAVLVSPHAPFENRVLYDGLGDLSCR